MSYEAFLTAFVWVCIGLIGILATLTLSRVTEGLSLGPISTLVAPVGLSLCAAIATVLQYTAAGWLMSGLENPLFVVCGLWATSCMVRSGQSLAQVVGVACATGLLGIVRVEAFVLLAPLLLAEVVVFCLGKPRREAIRSAAVLVGVPVAMWLAVNLLRFAYFGHLFPNSALAEGKSGGAKELVAITVFSLALCAPLCLVAIGRMVFQRGREYRTNAVIVAGFAMLGSVLLVASGKTDGSFTQLLGTPDIWPGFLSPGSGVIWLLASVVVLLVVDRLQRRATWLPHFVFAALVFVPLAQMLVFGPARLDSHRVSSLAVPFLAAWLAVLVLRVGAHVSLASAHDRRRVPVPILVFCLIVGGVATGGVAEAAVADPPHFLCCTLRGSGTPHVLQLAEGFQRATLGGRSLPILANPDLGAISFPKVVINEDLGDLGDPLLTRLVTSRPDLVPTFLNQVATPDVVEAHQYWECLYRSWILSTYFRGHYEVIYTAPNSAEPGLAKCPNSGAYEVWQRMKSPIEYGLTRALRTTSDPVGLVRRSLEACASARRGVFRCEYVRRAVLRDFVALTGEGVYQQVVQLFTLAPSRALDLALLKGGAGWDDTAYRAFVSLAK
jgi:hypothetical protein